MEKSLGPILLGIKGLENFLASESRRKGQHAARQAFGETKEIGLHGIASQRRAGAAKSRHDFIGDQEGTVCVAALLSLAQKFR